MTAEEKLKMLISTGEFDFIKEIPKDALWKLLFMAAFVSDTARFAQPERKKGKWILDDDGIPAICSECGTNWINDYVDSRELYITGKIPNYCPECGSDNRGEQE